MQRAFPATHCWSRVASRAAGAPARLLASDNHHCHLAVLSRTTGRPRPATQRQPISYPSTQSRYTRDWLTIASTVRGPAAPLSCTGAPGSAGMAARHATVGVALGGARAEGRPRCNRDGVGRDATGRDNMGRDGTG